MWAEEVRGGEARAEDEDVGRPPPPVGSHDGVDLDVVDGLVDHLDGGPHQRRVPVV